MFGIGGWEFMIIAVLALMLFGPDKLPQFARTIGRLMRDFKRYQDIMESTLRAEIYATDPDKVDALKRSKVPGKKADAVAEDGKAAAPASGSGEAPSEEVAASEAPAETQTPEERAAALPEGHPLASAVAAGDDVGIDDDLDLSALDPDDFGWTPGSGGPGKGVDGEGD